jgi:hypothetical protein
MLWMTWYMQPDKTKKQIKRRKGEGEWVPRFFFW